MKFLLYYDVDSADELNQETVYIERIVVQNVWRKTFHFPEILAYDEGIADATSAEYAKVKLVKSLKL